MQSLHGDHFVRPTVTGSKVKKKGSGKVRVIALTQLYLVKLGGMPPNLLLSCDFFLSYPAGVSGRVLYLTRFFLLLLSSSGNTSKTYSFDMPRPISTKLGHKNPWPMAFMSYDQNGVKGHVGVTGVKKVKNSKMLLLLQITGYDHMTHVYASAWPPLQKLSL